MPKIYKKHTLNEALPGFVGGNTAEVNGQPGPSKEMVSSVENSSPGGVDLLANDAHRGFDWINGNGPYGVAGRDFSYSISSLALVNPYAAGAVLGVIGAGAVVHGIMTSAYVRSKQTIRRLKRIYKGVMGPKGYALGTTNWLFFGLFSNIGNDSDRLGVVPFYNEIDAEVTHLKKEADAIGITATSISTMSPKDFNAKKAGMSHILTQSYVNFYIPEAEISKSKERYKDLLDKGRFRYDKNVEETYGSITKKMQESTVNAPLIAKKENYLERINELGKAQVDAFDTKMGYSLKKGGNRSVSCSQKLHKLWTDMMTKISLELDKKVAATYDNTQDNGKGKRKGGKFTEMRELVDAIYQATNEGFTPELLSKELYQGMIYMAKNGAGNQAPVMLSVGKVTKSVYSSGKVPLEYCNTGLVTTPLSTTITLKKLSDGSEYSRMYETKRPEGIAQGRWYRLNYMGSSATQQGQWTSYVYVDRIYPVKKGYSMVDYSYANTPYPSAYGKGVIHRMKLDKFKGLVLGEILEQKKLKEGVEEFPYAKLFEADDTSVNQNQEQEVEQEDTVDNTTETKGTDLSKYAFTNRGVYVLYATEKKDIVKTNDPVAGEVHLLTPYNGKDKFTFEEWCDLMPIEIPEMEDEISDFDFENAVLDDNDIKEDTLKYPLKYGVFANVYMNRKYHLIYDNIIIQHSDELKKYALKWDATKKRFVGLYETEIVDENNISDSKNFRNYLTKVIPTEVFLESAPENTSDAPETEEDTDKKNESVSFKQICKLFEAGNAKSTKNVGNTTSTNKQELVGGDKVSQRQSSETNMDTMNSKGDGVVNKGNNNQITIEKNGTSEEGLIKIIQALCSNGMVATPQKNIQFADNGDIVVPNQDDVTLLTEIPEIIYTICLEIFNKINSITKGIKKGEDRTKFNSAPQIFVGDKEVVEEVLTNGANEEEGVMEITDVPSDTSTNLEKEFNFDFEKEEPVKLEKIEESAPSDSSVSTEDSSVKLKKSLTFRIKDKFVKFKDKTSKALEKMNLRTEGITKKGSDQEQAQFEANCGVEVGRCYIVGSDWLKDAVEKYNKKETTSDSSTSTSSETPTDSSTVESYFDNYDYTKLYEDGEDNAPESINESDKDVLVQINAIDKEKVDIEYVLNGENRKDSVLPSSFREAVDADGVEVYTTFTSFDFGGNIYSMSSDVFGKIERYITDKTKLKDVDGKYIFIAVKDEPTKLSVVLNFAGKEYEIPYIDIFSADNDSNEAIVPVSTFNTLLGASDKFFTISYESFEKYFDKFVEKKEQPAQQEEPKPEDSSANTAANNLEEPKEVILHLIDTITNDHDTEFEFDYKTDIDSSNGVAPTKLRNVSIFELSPDIEFKDAQKPNDWESVKKEEKPEDTKYPDEAKGFLSSVAVSRLQTLGGLLHKNPEGINKNITDYFNAHKNPYKDLDSVIGSINDEMVGKLQDDKDKVEYLETLINALLGKQPMFNPNDLNKDSEKDRWLVYTSNNGEFKKVPIKVKGIKDEIADIIVTDASTSKEYTVSLKDNKYAIVESAFNTFRVGYKSYDAYMKHILYRVPLNESLVFNVGSPDAIEKIIGILVGKDNSSVCLLNILLNAQTMPTTPTNNGQQNPQNSQQPQGQQLANSQNTPVQPNPNQSQPSQQVGQPNAQAQQQASQSAPQQVNS